jgi:hypothetical protein
MTGETAMKSEEGWRVSVRWEHEIRNTCVRGVVLSKTQMKQTLIAMQEHNSGTERVRKNNSYETMI